METTQKLSGYVTDQVNQDSDVTRQNIQDTAPFMTLFGVNLVHRFPGVVDLDSIDVPTIRNLARFSAISCLVGLEVWNEIIQTRRQRPRQSRAA